MDWLKAKKSTFGTLKVVLKQWRAWGKLTLERSSSRQAAMCPAIGLSPAVINTDRERRLLSMLIALVPLLVA
jgi:hypothetical protein